jgi:HEAT repeats
LCMGRLFESMSAIVALSLSVSASAQTTLTREQALKIQSDCVTIEQCIAAMRTETAVNFSNVLEKKFEGLGEAAVDPLMDVLTKDPSPRMRGYAGIALREMPRIDARHLPALIAEDSKSDPLGWSGDNHGGWLAIPIGLVRDNPQALSYLFDLAEAQGLRARSNAVEPGIERSSRAAWLSEAKRRLEGFQPNQSSEFLSFLYQLVRFGWSNPEDKTIPPWLEPALARIATNSAINVDARATAEAQLRDFDNPIALAALLRDARLEFAALKPWDGHSQYFQSKDDEGKDQWERLSDNDVEATIASIGRFGAAAREAGPLLVPFLGRGDLRDSRAEAARTLARIGYREAIPALLAAARDSDDWLLTYNAIEALGLLKAFDARETLSNLANSHWSQAVRNNALRALNLLDGGSFERKGVPNDGKGINDPEGADENDNVYFGPVRYKGDIASGSIAECLDDFRGLSRLAQSPVGSIRFPHNGAIKIVGQKPRIAAVLELPKDVSRQIAGGRITMAEQETRGMFVGTDGGEFIGGLSFVPARGGTVVTLVPDNISLSFRRGGRLYVVTGLSHLFTSYGEIWEIDEKASPPRAVRRIRLPSEARHVLATARHDIAFVTSGDSFLLSEDGKMKSGKDEGTCRAAGR